MMMMDDEYGEDSCFYVIILRSQKGEPQGFPEMPCTS